MQLDLELKKIKLSILSNPDINSQSDIAQVLSVSDSLVSRVFCGRRKLSRKEANKWAETLKCDLDSLAPMIQE